MFDSIPHNVISLFNNIFFRLKVNQVPPNQVASPMVQSPMQQSVGQSGPMPPQQQGYSNMGPN